MDEVARTNRRFWDEEVRLGTGFTRPWLELTLPLLQDYVDGRLDAMPEPYRYLYPRSAFRDVVGRSVLCLASGGGQQSAAFGLLGARVTVLDLSEGMLHGDEIAAAHHGYPVRALQGDMRDLSALKDGEFDLVYQEVSLGYVPEVHPVYAEVSRVLRSGGRYRVGHCNPAVHRLDEDSWDGRGYRLLGPYRGGREREDNDWPITYVHLLSDIFNGLGEVGLGVKEVWENPQHLHHDPAVEPGSWFHMMQYVGAYFAIMARRA